PQLGEIPFAKLRPALRFVRIPAAKLRRRCQVARPFGELRPVFRDATRPKALDEDACAVILGGWLVDALQSDVALRHLFTPPASIRRAAPPHPAAPETPRARREAWRDRHAAELACTVLAGRGGQLPPGHRRWRAPRARGL